MLDPAMLTKPWYRKLRTPEKLAFVVLLCVCDEIGIWTVDEEWVEMLVGQRVDWESLTLHCNGNLVMLDEKHVLIPDYFRFQYPRASRNNPVTAKQFKKIDDLRLHRPLGLPDLHSLDTTVVPARYQLGTAPVQKEKEKESSSLSQREEKTRKTRGEGGEEGTDEERVEYSFADHVWDGISDEQVESWGKTFPACDVLMELRRMGAWLEANPAKRKSNYKRFITNWLTRSQEKGGTK